MKVTFFGVRGSIAAPGSETTRYGGNTPCISVESDNFDFHLILDSGTGIIPLGDLLIADNKPIYLLLSHNHWDHIQGFPFFRPAYQQGRKIFIVPGLTSPYEPKAILNQFNGTYFPVNADELSASIEFLENQETSKPFNIGALSVERAVLNHPNGGSGYKFSKADMQFAYITDNELNPPYSPNTSLSQWQLFIHNIDLLIHDAQYHPNDFPAKSGWGHSHFYEVVNLAIDANVKNLCLFSHDHRRNDQDIDFILKLARQHVKQRNSALHVFVAQENCGFDLSENNN